MSACFLRFLKFVSMAISGHKSGLETSIQSNIETDLKCAVVESFALAASLKIHWQELIRAEDVPAQSKCPASFFLPSS